MNTKGMIIKMKKGIIGVLSTAVGAAAGILGTEKIMQKEIDKKQKLSDKHLALFKMMNEWVRVKQKGAQLSTNIEKRGMHKIAIYGMNYAGETLVEELRGSSIEIVYGIDRHAKNLFAEFPIVSMEDELKEVDGIIVTAITYFDEIEAELKTKVDCPIVSLQDVIYEGLFS